MINLGVSSQRLDGVIQFQNPAFGEIISLNIALECEKSEENPTHDADVVEIGREYSVSKRLFATKGVAGIHKGGGILNLMGDFNSNPEQKRVASH